ncbi:MAG: DUF4974 domain-containing protein [Marinifilaceae bacterium]|nr:DUF4974 domain-containing protein [Marinifilaceae bacterium]
MNKQKPKTFITWELIAKSFRDELRPEEEQQLKEWLHSSPQHERFYRQAMQGGNTDPLVGLPESVLETKRTELLQRIRGGQKHHRTRHLIQYLSYAASILLIIMVGTWLWVKRGDEGAKAPKTTTMARNENIQLRLSDGRTINLSADKEGTIQEQNGAEILQEKGKLAYRQDSSQHKKEIQYNELSVPTGGECQLVLEDGTKLWINSNTRVKYPVSFPDNKREIIVSGEIYLEVVKDGRPFLVNTGAGQVRVLGTSFGVQAYGEEVLTTLVSGRVRFTNKAGHKTELKAGEQAVATANGEVTKREVRVEEYVGWKDGWYIFREQRLEDVMTTLNRWYGTNVFYQNPRVKDIRFTGNLKRYESIKTFLEVLAASEDVHYKLNGETIILY